MRWQTEQGRLTALHPAREAGGRTGGWGRGYTRQSRIHFPAIQLPFRHSVYPVISHSHSAHDLALQMCSTESRWVDRWVDASTTQARIWGELPNHHSGIFVRTQNVTQCFGCLMGHGWPDSGLLFLTTDLEWQVSLPATPFTPGPHTLQFTEHNLRRGRGRCWGGNVFSNLREMP